MVFGTQTNRNATVGAKREFTQLERLQEHLATQFEAIRADLDSAAVQGLAREIRRRTTSSVPEHLRELAEAVEHALRILKVTRAEIQTQLDADVRDTRVEGVPDLPPRLARFLQDRRESEGFHYEVTQDRLRGWVIRWKEYSEDGTIRGAGQFAERPYAWLDD